MVTVIDALERANSQNEKFTALILSGGLELVKSDKSGKFYATVRKASIPSTLELAHAKSMVGSKIPGTIKRVPCEPYEFKTDSGEEILLEFTYEYVEDENNVAETVLG